MRSREVPLIAGPNILDVVDNYNTCVGLDTVYHGTPLELQEIEPRTCRFWLNGEYVPDTTHPVVCASEEPVVAAFRALVPRAGRTFGCARVRNREGGLTFFVPRSQKRKLISAVGYVSLCDKADFKLYVPVWEPGREVVSEFRSDTSVRPMCNVAVGYADFEELLYADPTNRLFYTQR